MFHDWKHSNIRKIKAVWRQKMGVALILPILALTVLAACGKGTEPETGRDAAGERTEIQVFLAASLNTAMEQAVEQYKKENPDVKVTLHADSSGTLLNQIREGYECDIFFSAAQRQMDLLEESGLVEQGSRTDVVNNQVVVVTGKDSGTGVRGLLTIEDAESIALAGSSVPVGKYTRQALINLGILENELDPAEVTTVQVSEALGGVEISEQDNVSKVLTAVREGSCEVGTIYYSDTYGCEDDLEILEYVDQSLSGDVTYPICLVENQDADEAQRQAARSFYDYILSDEAKAIFELYYFDTDVKG